MKGKSQRSNRFRNLLLRGVSTFVLGFCTAFSAQADTTTLSVSPASKGTSNIPVTLNFPITRSGDTSYAAVLSYHTVDGTAMAGIDYTAAAGSITIPTGSTSVSIPVTIAANTSNAADQTFQLLLDTATGIGPAPSFAAQQSFGTRTNAYSVTVADVNGDGKPDLIVADYSDSTVSVLLNTTPPGATTPSFAAQQTFVTGLHPYSVTVADVNGDGMPDLIVTNYTACTVSVLLNTTAPGATTLSFAAQLSFAAGLLNPGTVTVADVNGDGKLDLIVGGSGNVNVNTVSVLLNTTPPGATTPSFATQQTFATGSGSLSVTAADVNGDGKPDLIVANMNDNTVSVLLNTTAPGAAAPSFATQQIFATGQWPTSVTTADVNGDGKPDLIVANCCDATISVLLNTTVPGATTSSFAAQQTFATGAGPYSVTAADVNGDGIPDLIVANYNGNTASVLLNTTAPGATSPSFATQQVFATGSDPESATIADVNGDGMPDLVVANNGSVSVLLNTTAPPITTPNFAAQHSFLTGRYPFSVTAADVNGDGKPDLFVANQSDNTVSVLLNITAPGSAAPSFAAQQTFAAGGYPTSVIATDVNGDGKPDLVATNYGDNTASVLLNTTAPGASTPSFVAQQTFATGVGPFAVTTADVNGDGKPDLIVANTGAGGSVSVLLNTTTAGATSPSFAAQQIFASGAGGASPYSVAVADVNGDGKPDLIVANYYDNTVSVLLNTTAPGAATPSFATQQTFVTGTDSSADPRSVTAADVNGDGKPDLIVANQNDNTISVLLNTTPPGATIPSFAAQQTFAAGWGPVSVSTTDVNGDGKPDLIVANDGGNTVSVLLNTTTPGAATPSFAAQQTFITGLGPFSVTAADVNGDGKPDLIVANTMSNAISVLLNSRYQAVIAGSPATGTIVHDYIFANGFE